MINIYKETLYYKILADTTKGIINGEIKPGDKIVSVRNQAKHYKMNPQTVQKAYSILIDNKIIIPKVGSGNFLTEDEDLLSKLRNEFLEDEINSIVNKVVDYKIDIKKLISKLEEINE